MPTFIFGHFPSELFDQYFFRGGGGGGSFFVSYIGPIKGFYYLIY